MATAHELDIQIADKRTELRTYFDSHREDGKLKMGDSQIAEVNRRNDELTKLGKDRDQAINVEQIEAENETAIDKRRQVVNPIPHVRRSGPNRETILNEDGPLQGEGFDARSLAQQIVESRAYQSRGRNGGEGAQVELADFELRALMATTQGIAPQTTINRPLVAMVQPSLSILDLIPDNTTDQVAITYPEETVYVNNAAETAEGAAYPEAELKVENKTTLVRKIAVLLPVTDEQLEDVGYAQGYIANRLPLMIRQRLQRQVLAGTGVGSNLLGLFNMTGILNQAVGADDPTDAIYKGIIKILMESESEPDAVVMNPLDWQAIRLQRTTQGMYIWGNPSDAGPERIWSLPVVKSTVIVEGNRLVGGFRGNLELAYKKGLDVKIGYNKDDFGNGRQSVRADVRVAFANYRKQAFCNVTGQKTATV